MKKLGVRIFRDRTLESLHYYENELKRQLLTVPPNEERVAYIEKTLKRLKAIVEKRHRKIDPELNSEQTQLLIKIKNKIGKKGVELSKKEKIFLNEFCGGNYFKVKDSILESLQKIYEQT